MESERPHRSYLTTVFNCRCPRCREGKLFRHSLSWRFKRNMVMEEKCPACGQVTDIEVGFYYGTGYVSYVIALLITIVFFLLWFLAIGFSFSDRRFIYWITLNSLLLICLQPWLMRFSRVLWLSWFVSYDPDWERRPPEAPERINKDQMNNW
ncbi:MAG TPA: DUF983 domain-containing protein [Flavisolibacter sp.]|nr:DUF983 domain-containing protein [Flavisolibacter sp.]